MPTQTKTVVGEYRDNGRVRMESLREATRDQLLTLKRIVDTDLTQIGQQIAEAKLKAQAGQGYSDPEWFARINAARRFKGRLGQDIQAELGKRKREEKLKNKEANQGTVPAWAIAQALLKRLPAEEQEEVLSIARQIALKKE